MSDFKETLASAQAVLADNDHGTHTLPAQGLYPHQWLWDSCFVAIGLRHIDIDRAQTELLSLLKGQWHNGMIPHMVLAKDEKYQRDVNIWHSSISKYSPDAVPTSGITQPPVLAEAVVRIGERLKAPERRSWYKKVFPAIVRHHEWLYEERDPHKEGLVLLIHPWETGLDNTPPWMSEMHDHVLPLWIRAVDKLKLSFIINLFRRDTKFIPAEQRLDTVEALALYSTQRRLRRKNYDIDRILRRSLFTIEDLTFNCVLVRANQHLVDMAKLLHEELPDELLASMKRTEAAIEQLWDPYSGQYYSRNFVTHKLLKEPTLATLMPLYAGTISKERAKALVRLLENQHVFGTHYPVPSVPKNSDWFKPLGYWQGPTWVNTNWLIIDGLKRMGFNDHAEALRETTIDLVADGGVFEYYSPLDGTPAGAANFSWTAALTIDLIKSS
jgi:hypothetical protein